MRPIVPANVAQMGVYVPGKPIEELTRELGIADVIKLASNENPLGPSPRVAEAVAQALGGVHRYPDAEAHALRSALARHHDVAFEDICLGNGSNELIDLVVRTFVASDEHVVFAAPSFVCYRLAAVGANVAFTEVPLRGEFAWNVEDLLAAVRPETKVLFVANPNNPTGTYMGRQALSRLVDELPPSVILVLDEAYVEFPDATDFISALELRHRRERMLVLRTFSKAYGLAGYRVGYALGPSELIGYLGRLRAPFNVNSLAQIAARVALDDQAHLERYVALNREERRRMTRGLEALGVRVVPSQANFVLVELDRAAQATYEGLLRMGVIVRPMPAPLERCLRVTIGLPVENERFLEAMATLLRGGT